MNDDHTNQEEITQTSEEVVALPEVPVEMEMLSTDDEMIETEPEFPNSLDLLYPGEEPTETMLLEAENSQKENFELELDYLDDDKQEDKLWQARTGLNVDTLCGAIETLIFMSDKPVALSKIRKMIDEDMPLRVLHESVARLQEEYEAKHHGIRLVEVADGYQFRTKATYSKYVQDLFKVNSLVLSPTALEVLAIISYKQPVAKTEVDKIRGVDSGHIVRGLMDKSLVKVVGRSDEVGRPVLYGTTPEFLEVFNLANIEDLPPEHELEELAKTSSVGKIADIKSLVHSGDKERFSFDEIGELDDLAEVIKSITADTDFTKSLKVHEQKRTTESGAAVRTAFDLLEEYLDKTQITDANKESLLSEAFTNFIDPQVIHDLAAGPFNAPDPMEEEEEEFQMIDLETGLPIEDENEVEVLELEGIELLAGNESEREELAAALDDAFAKLTGEKLEECFDAQEMSDKELSLNQDRVEEKASMLEELTEQIAENAKELDIDLSFLNEKSEDITDSNTEN